VGMEGTFYATAPPQAKLSQHRNEDPRRRDELREK